LRASKKCRTKAIAPDFVLAFAASGITGGLGLAEAEGDGVFGGAGAGAGSGFPPQPLSSATAAHRAAASRGPSVRIATSCLRSRMMRS
jgi:hypothetical protein